MGTIASNNTSGVLHEINNLQKEIENSCVPKTRKINGTALSSDVTLYTYGTSDLTAGSSPLATGTLYFVYK